MFHIRPRILGRRRSLQRLCPFVLLVVVLVAPLVGCGDDSPSAPEGPSYRSPDLCIMLEDPSPDVLASVARDYEWQVLSVYGSGRFAFVSGEFDPATLTLDERILAFQRDADTAISSPVELTMSFFEGDFEQDLPAQDAFTSWYLPSVHATSRGAGVKVAVLDTGVDPTHAWLVDRVRLLEEGEWGLGSLERADGLDTDGDGVVDAAYGHGTHVAGTIATVAPDAEILAIRVLDSDGVGTAFDLARALVRAQEWGADIINLSLVLNGESDVVDEILNDLHGDKVVIVGAAGNQPGPALFPASESEVLSVAAHDLYRGLASFSASEGVRLAAPGVEVLSAFPGDRWASATGTSMACAAATGAVAILTAVLGDADRAEGILRGTALDLEPVDDGAIDLLSALADAAREIGRRASD